MADAMNSNAFNLEFNTSNPDVPTPNEILSLKLLKDTNKDIFDPLYQDQTKYLSVARTLLLNDKWLQTRFNGTGLESMSALAKILKKRSNEVNMEKRIDGVIKEVLNADYSNNAGLKPIGNAKSIIKNNGGKLEFRKYTQGAISFEV